ncbi:MAG TPA: formyltransferase family protein [Fluviicola sp.]|nr:formyltransferase family protein [Fluviicola sp.]
MGTYILLSEKKVHRQLLSDLKNRFPGSSWMLIAGKDDFNLADLEQINPDKIFIPHWSYLIPEEIYSRFECIVFHMTDLPYGRGGSPLQNLIVRGYSSTKISAIRVEEGIDTGPVYLKAPLDLSGTAAEILDRASEVIGHMIGSILLENPVPQVQEGEIVLFKRRGPKDGDLATLESVEQVYDYIRMLDGEGYPNAFIETETLKFDFSNAVLDPSTNTVNAHVRITKK